jgi:hypothetical protein
LALKELGILQEKILKYLSKNPNCHNQEIQRGINHPEDQYSSVYNSTKALEKQGYIESIEKLSEKNVKIKCYNCTQRGLIYTFLHSPDTLLEIADIYLKKYPELKFFQTQLKCFGHDLSRKFFELLWQQVILLDEKNIIRAFKNGLVSISTNEDFTLEERKHALKCLKLNLKLLPPEYKQLALEQAKEQEKKAHEVYQFLKEDKENMKGDDMK